MVVLTDEDTNEAGRHFCSSGTDIQSRSTPGDRSLFNSPNVRVDRQYYHQLSFNWPFWPLIYGLKGPVDRRAH